MNTKELRDQLDQIARLEVQWRNEHPGDYKEIREQRFRNAVVDFWLSGGRELADSLARKEALLRTIRDKCRLSSTHHIHVSDEELAEIERS